MKKNHPLITASFCVFLSLPVFAGEISFAPYVIIPTGSCPKVVAVGDVNHDGRNDVVLGTSSYFDSLYDYKVFVYRQTSNGALDTPQIYNGGDISSIDIDDLNNDGYDDVAIGFSDSIGIFFQDSSGCLHSKASFFSGLKVKGLKIGDFNGDGLHDIATALQDSSILRIHVQGPYGCFNTHFDYYAKSTNFSEIEAGDITDDGLDDVVLLSGLSYTDSSIAVFVQDSLHNLKSPFYLSIGQLMHWGIGVGDLNGDGRNDIVATYGGNKPDAQIGIWPQEEGGNLQMTPVIYAGYECPEPVEITDFDLDGRNDVIVGNGGWNAISFYQQNTSGTFSGYDSFAGPGTSHYHNQGMAVGDINNDNKPDLVMASFDSDENGLVIFYNTSTTGVSGEQAGQIEHRYALTLKIVGNKISYGLPQSVKVSLKIYNLLGQQVSTLFRGNETAGSYKINWDGRDDSGRRVASGVYLVRLEANGQAVTGKMLVVR